MGTLKIVSADPDKALSLKVEALKTVFPLKQGDIFSAAKVRKAIEDYGKAYGQYGFIDFTAEPEFDIDDADATINLTLRFSEEKQYYVRRIDFTGNTTTRDKVIRRELLLDEGQLFNKRAWEISILRLNQLNYFDRIEEDKAVEIKRNTKDGTVDLNLKLKEKGKQSIGLQGGVSGLAGTFIGLTYQTNNFLGLGETLTFSAQFGDLQRSFMFGFTEPYLFDRPISTGFTIFEPPLQFRPGQTGSLAPGQSVSINPEFVQNYTQNSTGFTVFAQYPVKRLSFTRLSITYGLTHTNIQTFNEASQLLFEQLQFTSVAGPSALRASSPAPSLPASATTPSTIRRTRARAQLLLFGRRQRRSARRQRQHHYQRFLLHAIPSRLQKAQRPRPPLHFRLHHRLRRQRSSSVQPLLHGRRTRSSRLRHSLHLAGHVHPDRDLANFYLLRPDHSCRLPVHRCPQLCHSHSHLSGHAAGRRPSDFRQHRIPHPASSALSPFLSSSTAAPTASCAPTRSS